MCGIGVVIEASTTATSATTASTHQLQLEQVLRRRGPDQVASACLHPNVTMVGAVLHLRGTDITPQPIIDESGNHLVWNGEIYACGNTSDTTYMSRSLNTMAKKIYATTDTTTRDPTAQATLATALLQHLQSCHGPYSFAWWHTQSSTLWYGRDPLGRRSLLVGRTAAPTGPTGPPPPPPPPPRGKMAN
jgi:asparagine synthetase B (glutamine-hydrolysing)